jgi:uncharacterized protein YcbK (DUF882 family)
VKILLVLCALTAVAHADPTSKKDAEWTAKHGKHAALRAFEGARRLGKPAAAVVSLYNIHTHEWIAVPATQKKLPVALLDRFLRDHFTNEPTDMDPRLGGVLLDAARNFRASRINVVSGFRSPKYNLMLRKKGHRVARESQHTLGHAVDFFLPDVSTEQLYDWAMKHQIGGVGKYISDGFVHMDVGRRRTWIDP